ncbi:telomere recombination-domain-containing protein [Corynascus novoguineensis]|uniref:Threonylcarbamoyl-AMP synthase n=1 Tax=Corynascus novoguineensis TaxID=1126955 RepID=A0AAN7CUB7_9PEZI|nr:telomere recombination-domain-containing protein [Corynascus novoguineensis]
METRILKVPLAGKEDSALGRWASTDADGRPNLESWEVTETDDNDAVLSPLREAAHLLRTTAVPVAFPTETVYGLGADATRSDAVKGIYSAKGRPSDNPLIVHVSDLSMLRGLLSPATAAAATTKTKPTNPSSLNQDQNGEQAEKDDDDDDPIPANYRPLIRRFWPGPLTILLPLPSPSPLAPEVTASQPAFGVRMPASALARSLIALTGKPLAAPSANASTRPSPTAAWHVAEDLRGRVQLVLDGGSCDVGVESTVVDGLCSPPAVLRPGGVGIEALRSCEGWEGVVKAYADHHHAGEDGDGKKGAAPRAPGMKYKHYSPRAKVVLFEAGGGERRSSGSGSGSGVEVGDVTKAAGGAVGFIRTGGWDVAGGLRHSGLRDTLLANGGEEEEGNMGFVVREGALLLVNDDGEESSQKLLDVDLGRDVKGVAHGLFGALRELDRLGADVIFVEGVSDGDDMSAAVMNRLRKAASEIRA